MTLRALLSTTAIGLILLPLSAFKLRAAETPRPALLVLSKADHTLAIVDPQTLKVVARMPSGPDPHEVIASEDGKTAYISNYGGGAYNTLTVADLIEQKTTGTIDLGALRGPHGLTAAGGKIWFTAEGAKAVGRYDPATQKIDWILGTGQDRTHMIFVFPDLARLITTNISSATVTIAEKKPARAPGPPPGMPPGAPPPMARANAREPRPTPQPNWEETVIAVGKGAEGFDVSPDRSQIWTANAQDGTISIIDIPSKKVVRTVDANVKSANRLKFTPDGKLVFVSSLNGSDVTILDAHTHQVSKQVKVGHGAAGIEMQPDGSRVFVACTPDNYVAVIDLKSLEVTGHLDAGGGPDGMAWVK
jgi:YVTN family beta-propeller protein